MGRAPPALPSLVVLLVVFGIACKIKGWKIALLATGAAFALSVLLLVALIFLITRNM